MVIEHAFITTRESEDTLATASNYLAERGFVATDQRSFDMSGRWTAIEMVRRNKSAARSASIAEQPMLVRVEWDRGRVSVAASITPKNLKQEKFTGSPAQITPTDLERGPAGTAMAGILFTICVCMELVLTQPVPRPAIDRWATMDAALERRREHARRKNRRVMIGLLIFFGVIILLIVLLVISAQRD